MCSVFDRREVFSFHPASTTKAVRLYEETGIRLRGPELAMHDETVSLLRRTVSEAQWGAAVKLDACLQLMS